MVLSSTEIVCRCFTPPSSDVNCVCLIFVVWFYYQYLSLEIIILNIAFCTMVHVTTESYKQHKVYVYQPICDDWVTESWIKLSSKSKQ